MNKKILICGVGGMVGSVLSRSFLNKGYEVWGADNFLTSHPRNLNVNVKFYQIDLCEAESVKNLFDFCRPDFVINVAAEASEILSPHIRRFSYYNNIISHANILNECINFNVKKVILFSSIGVYGHLRPPFTEAMIPQPADPYSVGKRIIELDAETVWKHFGLEYSIVRPYNLFCKYQQYNNLYRNALAIWIRKLILGEPLTIFGDGFQKRSFSSCECLNEPIEKLLYGFNDHIFNLGSEKPIRIIDACELVKKIGLKFGFNSDIIHLEPRNEVKLAWCSTEKAKTMLGFEDNTDLEKLIYEMFEFALSLPKEALSLTHKMTYEVEKNLPPAWK